MDGIISLAIRYRDIESSASQTLGTARFQLADVVQATNLSFQKQCRVSTITGDIVIGRISIKVELGCRGLHFGGDFLDAIIGNCSNINANRCQSPIYQLSNQYFDGHPNHAEYLDSCRDYEWRKYERKMDDLFYETCLYDIHDEQPDDKSDPQSRPLNTEAHSNDAQKMNGKNLANIANKITDKDLIHGLCKSDELSDDGGNELKGLFHIGQINYCSWYQSTSETFLVCRPFWIDSALVTDNCQNKTKEENYQLNYLEVSPKTTAIKVDTLKTYISIEPSFSQHICSYFL